MQVSVEKTSQIGRRLTISIPAADVQSEINQRMNQVLRNKKIDGFRPGKVPKHMVQQKYGEEIRHEAIGKIIEKSLPLILQQEALAPAGKPEIEQVLNVNEENKDLTYIVGFEIFPEFTLPDFSTLQVEQYQADILESDVDKAIDNLCNQLATFAPVEREAKDGDRLIIDYTSLLNGKKYENSSNQDVSIELGAHTFIDGFEAGLVGAKANETRELSLIFPSEWRMEKLAGKPVSFTVTIKSVSEKKLAELDESFAKKIGADNSDLASIRSKVRANLEKQVSHLVLEKTKKQALDKLLEKTEIQLPAALVQNEVALLHEDLHRKMGDKAHDTCNHHGLEEDASRRVALSLLLREIVKLEKLTPDKEKIRKKILEIAKAYGNAEFIENMYYESEELLSGVQNTVLVDQAIDLILAKATITLKPITVEALFKHDV